MVRRILLDLQLLAHEMSPFLQQNRRHILEQAAQANAVPLQPPPTPFAGAGSEVFVNAPGGSGGQCTVLLLRH